MSNAATKNTVPSYTVDVEKEVGCYHVSLDSTGATLPIEREEIRDCAGDPLDRSLMVVERISEGTATGVEIIAPLNVEQAEGKDGCHAIELTLGRDNGDELVTVENGITFDRSDEGQLPGIEVDFTATGEVVAMRVERAAINTDRLL